MYAGKLVETGSSQSVLSNPSTNIRDRSSKLLCTFKQSAAERLSLILCHSAPVTNYGFEAALHTGKKFHCSTKSTRSDNQSRRWCQPGTVFGEILGLVGIGCGKSTLSCSILQLIPAGKVEFQTNLTACRRSLRQQRRQIQMVFQIPTCLNP